MSDHGLTVAYISNSKGRRQTYPPPLQQTCVWTTGGRGYLGTKVWFRGRQNAASETLELAVLD
eukprot:7731487-Heterocapsa_arctica.AAC.1